MKCERCGSYGWEEGVYVVSFPIKSYGSTKYDANRTICTACISEDVYRIDSVKEVIPNNATYAI